MTTNSARDTRTYQLVLREMAHLDGDLAACLFLILTTLTRAHEVTSAQARTTEDGCLEIRNTVGLNDVRIRRVPLAGAAIRFLVTTTEAGGAVGSHPATWGMTPLTMQRLLDDAEGVGGVQYVDQVWQIALAAVIASDPANVDAALAYAGIGSKRATPPSRESLQQVADVIDRLVIEAGLIVQSIDVPAPSEAQSARYVPSSMRTLRSAETPHLPARPRRDFSPDAPSGAKDADVGAPFDPES